MKNYMLPVLLFSFLRVSAEESAQKLIPDLDCINVEIEHKQIPTAVMVGYINALPADCKLREQIKLDEILLKVMKLMLQENRSRAEVACLVNALVKKGASSEIALQPGFTCYGIDPVSYSKSWECWFNPSSKGCAAAREFCAFIAKEQAES